MSRDHRQALIIQRAICYLIAAVGALLLWAGATHAALPPAPGFHGVVASSITAASIPDSATLLMLTAGLGCLFLKMRRGTV